MHANNQLVAILGKGRTFAAVAIAITAEHNAVGAHDPTGKERHTLKSFETSAEAYRYFADTITLSKLYGSKVLYLGSPNFG